MADIRPKGTGRVLVFKKFAFMIFGSQPAFARRALAERDEANIHRKVLALGGNVHLAFAGSGGLRSRRRAVVWREGEEGSGGEGNWSQDIFVHENFWLKFSSAAQLIHIPLPVPPHRTVPGSDLYSRCRHPGDLGLRRALPCRGEGSFILEGFEGLPTT